MTNLVDAPRTAVSIAYLLQSEKLDKTYCVLLYCLKQIIAITIEFIKISWDNIVILSPLLQFI